MLRVKAKAKINLYLDTLYKRDDGYHQVEMVMQSIDLADVLELIPRPQGIEVVTNLPYLPIDQRNLAYRAAALLQQRFEIDQGVKIDIEKRIPVAAGLAGGSTDAGAVLVALNQLWNLGLSLDQLQQLGAELGSDVPFCIQGGTALATGRGELVTPLAPLPKLWVVVATPPLIISTAEVYRSLNLEQHQGQGKKRLDQILSGLDNRDPALIGRNLYNVLETVTAEKHRQIQGLKAIANREGTLGTLMSGSGPTVFALTPDRRTAGRIVRLWKKQVKDVFLTVTG